MTISLKRLAIYAATSAFLFIPAANTWAVSTKGTAHLSALRREAAVPRTDLGLLAAPTEQIVKPAGARLPFPVRFREVGGRGLLISAWVNGAGPYIFAIDTGAGATILSRRVAAEARAITKGRRPLLVGGLSGSGTVAGQEVSVESLAIGDRANVIPSTGLVIVLDRLAPGVDGVLDPAEAFWPLGFELDMPSGQLTAFDARQNPLRRNQNPGTDETVVPWLFDGQSRRPYVQLEGGLRALIDTGSGFGLAVTQDAARSIRIDARAGREHADVTDLGGGNIAARRIGPSTVQLGSMVLRGIPTDLLQRARPGAPALLGREALRPFRLTFDPVNRLIRIMPG